MKEVKIGDSLWIPRINGRQENVTCPVCFGKKQVTLILGDDSCLEVDCDYCGKGYSGPVGTIKEYTKEPRAELFLVDTIKTETTNYNSKIEYQSGCYIAHEGDLFPTKEEALEEAKKRIVEQQAEQDGRADHIKKNAHKSFTWHVGYYKREIKRHREELASCERKLRLCKKRGR